jgi:hypothetical protein
MNIMALQAVGANDTPVVFGLLGACNLRKREQNPPPRSYGDGLGTIVTTSGPTSCKCTTRVQGPGKLVVSSDYLFSNLPHSCLDLFPCGKAKPMFTSHPECVN